MRRASARLLAIAAAVGFLSAGQPATAPDSVHVLLGDRYPIEIVASPHSALFHWLDSLANLQGPGLSAGKTVDAHREGYVRTLGTPSAADRLQIRRFAEVRIGFAERQIDLGEAGKNGDPSALLKIFLEAPTESDALKAAGLLLPAADVERISAALDHFRAPYARIWGNGRFFREFLGRVEDSGDADRLEDLLLGVARFYGISLPMKPLPRVVLVPVPSGYGTHASAVGRNLLVELRPGDGLENTASVLVHENAHFLFLKIPEARRRALSRVLMARGDAGERAWALLLEALPTALGQGVADRRFRRAAWTTRNRWYHIEDVDTYAKAIYPVVRNTLTNGGRFDEAFLERVWAKYPFPIPEESETKPTPR